MSTIVSSLVTYIQHDVAAQLGRPRESITHICHDRVTSQGGHVGRNGWHGEQVRRVLHDLTNGPVIRMVVAGAVCQHKIRLKPTHFTNHFLPELERGHELPVVVVPHVELEPR